MSENVRSILGLLLMLMGGGFIIVGVLFGVTATPSTEHAKFCMMSMFCGVVVLVGGLACILKLDVVLYG